MVNKAKYEQENSKEIDKKRMELKVLKKEYGKLSKATKPKLKYKLRNRLFNKSIVAIPPSREKTKRLNLVVLMISRLEKEIALNQGVGQQMKSYREEGVSEGYFSAMAQILTFVIIHQSDSPDQFITEFELRRKDFLCYLNVEDIEEIDRVCVHLTKKAQEMWLS